MCSLLTMRRAWSRRSPTARLVEIADAGHSIAVDQPARFLGAIASFLLGESATD